MDKKVIDETNPMVLYERSPNFSELEFGRFNAGFVLILDAAGAADTPQLENGRRKLK